MKRRLESWWAALFYFTAGSTALFFVYSSVASGRFESSSSEETITASGSPVAFWSTILVLVLFAIFLLAVAWQRLWLAGTTEPLGASERPADDLGSAGWLLVLAIVAFVVFVLMVSNESF